ncbi:MAG: DUF4129 domain-containing protein [Oscillibacter sp.]|nr:DUF4129 domain-containing protein [Oscillibacter sp.]MEA4992846.1 DUF4129 domain-containing protein [Oscillibacter sp.]
MKPPSRVFRSLLCLLAGMLLSLMELRFFGGVKENALTFVLISIVTVPAVFWYFRLEYGVAAPVFYTVFLAFLLELLGISVDVGVLLACLLVLAVLYMQSRMAAIEARPHAGALSRGPALVTVLLCALLVTGGTFEIYRQVLLPALPEGERVSLLERLTDTPEKEPKREEEQSPPPAPDLDPNAALEESAKGTKTAPALEPPSRSFSLGRAVLIAAVAGACFALTLAALRELRYRLWLRKMLASSPEEQVDAVYRCVVRAMAVCGYPRKPSETPLEYLGKERGDDAPVFPRQLQAVTESFLLSRYGGQAVSLPCKEECLAIFRALPQQVKRSRGRRFYYLNYLREMRRPFGPGLGKRFRRLTGKEGEMS